MSPPAAAGTGGPGANVDALFRAALENHQAGRLEAALAGYEEVLRREPGHADAHNNLGAALAALGRREEAVASYERALGLRPDHAQAHSNLGDALRELGRHEEAVASCSRALRLRPDFAEAHNNLGTALQALGRHEEAAASCKGALRLRPDFAEAHYNLGNALRGLGRRAEAMTSYERALSLRPDYTDAHWNLALTLLLTGRLREGWVEFEHRLRSRRLRQRFGLIALRVQRWDGSAFEGRTLLVQGEQGLGDVLQFVRYLPAVKTRGGRVVLWCAESLARLLAGCPGVDRVVVKEKPLPADLAVDLEIPIMSLARVFGTGLETIPAEVPYLSVEAGLADAWRERIGAADAFKVGLVWAGSPQHDNDRNRSLALAELAPLAAVRGVRFYSLQKGEAAAQVREVAGRLEVEDLSGSLGDFADTAAAMTSLDLVITVDTATAHLAGGLGLEVWTLLPEVPDWRWLLEREDSPWYPTMRLFRRRAAQGWPEVMARVAEALAARVARRG